MTKNEKIESLINAIASLNEYHKPDSDAYKLRNPLLLKSYSRPGKHDVDEQGRRKFDSFQGGYRSAAWDLILKIEGKSNTGLKPEDKLRNLLAVLGINQEQDIMFVVFFLRKALSDKNIEPLTPLEYFKD
jgi:hypothetical protein